MMNLLAKEFILEHLSPTQLNQLSKVNFELNHYIEDNRLKLPRKQFEILEIYNDPTRIYLDLRNHEESKHIEVSRTEVMKYLKHIRVESLSLRGYNDFLFLDETWLKQISGVDIYLYDIEDIKSLLKKLNVSKLSISRKIPDINGAKVLNSMPFVEFIMLRNAGFNREFFRKLAEKSNNGPGLDGVYFVCEGSNFFSAEEFINFLKNAKIQEYSRLNLRVQVPDRTQLQTMLPLLNEMPNWSANNEIFSRSEFVIKTPNTAIVIVNTAF